MHFNIIKINPPLWAGVTLAVFLLGMSTQAQEPSAQEAAKPVITERGPNHRVWTRAVQVPGADGSMVTRNQSFMELGTGLCFQQDGQWVDSKEVIEPFPGGAVAHFGQLKAAFAANLNTRGAIQVVNEKGEQLTSHICGLFYTDLQGQCVLIGELKDCVGEIIPPNQIIYRDAFTGCKIDVLYTYRLHEFEQDLIVREAPASPDQYGLDPETSLLQVFTEFLNPPQPTLAAQKLASVMDRAKHGNLPELADETIHFKGMLIGKGKAFEIGGGTVEVPTAKTWLQIEQRTFLTESVEYPAVHKGLSDLPKGPQARINNQGDRGIGAKVNQKLLAKILPDAPKNLASNEKRSMREVAQTASVRQPSGKGFVLDYVMPVADGQTDYVFRSDWTYRISGPVHLYGTNTIRGGTVIKYAEASSGACLDFNGTVVCDTSPTRPAVFTSIYDNTVGDVVAYGTISGYYATPALGTSQNIRGELHDLHIKYAATGIKWSNIRNERFYNIQLINCANGIERTYGNGTGPVPIHNLLAKNVNTLFLGDDSTIDAQHITASGIGSIATSPYSYYYVFLTNSILVNVTNKGNTYLYSDYLATNNCPTFYGAQHLFPAGTSPFVTVIGGQHYLPTNSGLRNIGTANIATNLLAELKKLTTYPPEYRTGTISTNTVFGITAFRDTNTVPDLGYHYTPLDYVVSALTINTNATLFLTNGAAIGIDYGGSYWGIIFDTAKLISQGSPLALNRIIRAHCVQENSSGNPGTRSVFYDKGNDGIAHGNSELRLRFTEMSALAQDGYTLYVGKHWSAFEWLHSQLYNTSFFIDASKGGQVCGITNTLVDGSDIVLRDLGSSSVFYMFNNLFRNKGLEFYDGHTNWLVQDNLFENCNMNEHNSRLGCTYNAYYVSSYATSYWLVNGDHNTNITTLTYENGPLGRFYQPIGSVLLNAGSRNATNAGLYHFTTTVDQLKETNSIVDIGLHYVSLNSSGQPCDIDLDTFPDYVEDANGNGGVDTGESDWRFALDSDGDGVPDWIEILQGANPYVGRTYDWDGRLNLQLFTPLK